MDRAGSAARRPGLGWRQVAFLRELRERVTPVTIGSHRLMLVMRDGGVEAYDALCPHMGADLTRGGRMQGDCITCPFHGRKIGLGTVGDDGLSLDPYPTRVAGGLVFVLDDPQLDNGFAAFLEDLSREHHFVPGFTATGTVEPGMVVENGLDSRHFMEVHKLTEPPALEAVEDTEGALRAKGVFRTSRANAWQADDGDGGGAVAFDYAIRVFSPGLCVSQISDAGMAYAVLTAATPGPDGTTQIRVSLAVTGEDPNRPEAQPMIRALLRDCRTSVEQDLEVWNHLPPQPYGRLVKGDELIGTFRQFCRRFG